MKTFRTLCSGGELFGVGARAAGWQHVDGFELEPLIAAVARLNEFQVHTANVCNVDYAALPYADHLHASPSCKTASQANTNGGEAPEDLAVADAVCRAIKAHQGRTFSLENVWGYRNYESFSRILAALHQEGFQIDYRHINSADYGVPQTRKRLILRAVRGARVPPLHPTHRKGGDMFHAPWVGWYAAIADLLPSLPETTPAPWQLARLPEELRETILIGPGGYDGTVVAATEGDPSFTVPAALNHAQWRAFLMAGAKSPNGNELILRTDEQPATTVVSAEEGRIVTRAFLMGDQSAGAGVGVQIADASTPAFTLRASDHNAPPRAYIIGGGNTQLTDIDSHARPDDVPMFTVSASDGARKTAAAFLMDGDNGRVESGEPTLRAHDEPAMTLRGTRSSPHRAYVGRWVRMTVQALGRFQTVPDSYIGLTPQINGNGVPCLLAQRIMESLARA